MLFNTIFDNSKFPSSWRLGIITSIFKKGHRNNPSNYQTILSNLGKVLTGILNTRIVRWVEKKLSSVSLKQASERADHVFVLKTTVDKFLTRKKGRFYCPFVDFSKAFDCVNRDYLIYIIIKNGMHGKMLKLLGDTQSNVTAPMKTKEGFTKPFECKSGVRQGCLLSPELSINKLERTLKLSEFRGIHIWEATEVLLLMYADDIVLVAETIIQLQRKINILKKFCRKYGMKVNLDKTKVMVFRNGGKTAKKNHFTTWDKKMILTIL